MYYNRFGETEGLIYDFSLDVGDTVFVDNQYLNYNEVVRLVVDSIDVADIYLSLIHISEPTRPY